MIGQLHTGGLIRQPVHSMLVMYGSIFDRLRVLIAAESQQELAAEMTNNHLLSLELERSRQMEKTWRDIAWKASHQAETAMAGGGGGGGGGGGDISPRSVNSGGSSGGFRRSPRRSPRRSSPRGSSSPQHARPAEASGSGSGSGGKKKQQPRPTGGDIAAFSSIPRFGAGGIYPQPVAKKDGSSTSPLPSDTSPRSSSP